MEREGRARRPIARARVAALALLLLGAAAAVTVATLPAPSPRVGVLTALEAPAPPALPPVTSPPGPDGPDGGAELAGAPGSSRPAATSRQRPIVRAPKLRPAPTATVPASAPDDIIRKPE